MPEQDRAKHPKCPHGAYVSKNYCLQNHNRKLRNFKATGELRGTKGSPTQPDQIRSVVRGGLPGHGKKR